MKKLLCIFLLCITICALAACGNQDNHSDSAAENQAPNPSASVQNTGGIDVDLTKLSSTMVYSEVYNIMNAPNRYIGKTVKMHGQFSYYQDPATKKQYFACIIADATACCSQGLEFVLTGEPAYPDDYPKPGSEITVSGTFEIYEENGGTYGRLTDAVLIN